MYDVRTSVDSLFINFVLMALCIFYVLVVRDMLLLVLRLLSNALPLTPFSRNNQQSIHLGCLHWSSKGLSIYLSITTTTAILYTLERFLWQFDWLSVWLTGWLADWVAKECSLIAGFMSKYAHTNLYTCELDFVVGVSVHSFVVRSLRLFSSYFIRVVASRVSVLLLLL